MEPMMGAAALPANLPSIANARLPQTYEAAKLALAECTRIDECSSWAKKAEALASYAKQAGDDSLRKMADRIQARAIKRCGELLRAIKPAQGANQNIRGGAPPKVTRTSAARDAGLSRDQKRTALRLAAIPESEFDEAIDAERPSTVTELAKRGIASRPVDHLRGRDLGDFRAATEALGTLRRLAEFTERIDTAAVARGADARERQMLRRHMKAVAPWFKALVRQLRR